MSSDSNTFPAHPLEGLLQSNRLPHIWCPGCGIGIVLGAYLRAITELKLDPKRLVLVSGIGCTGRAAGYVSFDSFHTTHGRAIPLAMGIKLARPSMNVTVLSGDGDLFAIGGNHFIHAARRNLDILVICVNNFNYGMTGGQLGPTTPFSSKTTTTPYGNIEHPFNLPYLAAAAGATFVARWTVAHPFALVRSIKKTFNKRGFSFIEVIAPCITLYARYNRMGGPAKIMRYLRDNSVVKNSANVTDIDIQLNERIVVGEFVNFERPEYISELYRIISANSGKDVRSLIDGGL